MTELPQIGVCPHLVFVDSHVQLSLVTLAYVHSCLMPHRLDKEFSDCFLSPHSLLFACIFLVESRTQPRLFGNLKTRMKLLRELYMSNTRDRRNTAAQSRIRCDLSSLAHPFNTDDDIVLISMSFINRVYVFSYAASNSLHCTAIEKGTSVDNVKCHATSIVATNCFTQNHFNVFT